MNYKEALFWITAIRMNYICDPHECHQDAYDPNNEHCQCCSNKHDALAIAGECIKKVMEGGGRMMTYEEALNELVYDNEERDWDNCMFDMAQGVYARCKEALEKQIPKKPIAYDKGWSGVTLYKCPVCNGLLGAKSFNEEQNQIGCARCLSAIDWSEVDE